MQHIADEPIEENIKSYIEIAAFVRKLAPDFKFIDACHSKNLDGMLDVWVPQLDYMNRDYEFYNKQHQSGKEIWFYTCLNPKFEYVNRFIELPLLRTRYMHWVNFKYNIPGYLHWGLNYWSLGIRLESRQEFSMREEIFCPEVTAGLFIRRMENFSAQSGMMQCAMV